MDDMPSAERPQADYSTKTGCKVLCDKIMAGWKARGHKVKAWPESIGGGYYVVKSDLVNGLPQ